MSRRPNLAPLLSIFELSVIAERWRQLKKWGLRSCPDGTGSEDQRYRAGLARARCNLAFKQKRGTWEHIPSEEVHEAYAESEYEPLRAELIQVATVALAWVEDLDNRHPALVPRFPVIDDEIEATVEPADQTHDLLQEAFA